MHELEMRIPSWQAKLLITLAFLSGFSVPVSTALENIATTALLLVAISITSVRKQIWGTLKQPFVMSCVIFYSLFIVGIFWSHASSAEIIRMLVKMRNYLFVPIFVAICLVSSYRRALIIGFAVAVGLNLFLSLFTWLIHYPILQGAHSGGAWTVFRSHTYHTSFILLLMAGLLAGVLSKKITGKLAVLSIIVVLLGVIDILFITDSRTGMIMVFVVLALVFLQWRLKQGIIISIILMLLVPVVYLSSPVIKERVLQARENITSFKDGGSVDSPVGVRMEFHRVSTQLIKELPILGHGTGSFAVSYKEYVTRTNGPKDSDGGILLSGNPHNDYMWVGVELGIVGIFALIAVILSLCYQSRKLSVPEKWLAIVLATTYAIITLQNSFFTDNISGVGFILLASAILGGKVFTDKLHA